MNTVAPWVKRDLGMLRNMWRFWYQIPMSLPVIGPRVISDPKGRYFRLLTGWVGGGFRVPDDDVRLYLDCMREPGHAEAGSRWYRTFQTREMLAGCAASTTTLGSMSRSDGCTAPEIR